MATKKYLSELEQKQLERDYTSSDPSKEAKGKLCARLAAQFGVSAPTVARMAKKGGWDTKRLVQTNATPEVIAEQVRHGIVSIDVRSVIATALTRAESSVPDAPVRSREGMLRAIAQLSELWLKMNPMTVDDIIDAMARTGVKPEDIVKRIKERLQQTG